MILMIRMMILILMKLLVHSDSKLFFSTLLCSLFFLITLLFIYSIES